MGRLHKVEGIYGPGYDPITKETLFTVNDIVNYFSGFRREADVAIEAVSVIIKNHDKILFSSEDISEILSGVRNRDYWVQDCFRKLEMEKLKIK
jgi:hypothetical protein